MRRFFFDDRCSSAVTKPYMDVLRRAAKKAGFSVVDAEDGATPVRSDVVVTNEVLHTIRYCLRGFWHHAVWIQGIVPEESYLRHHSRIRFWVLSCLERFVLKRAEFLFFVSPEMLLHYEKKYGLSISQKSMIMPCFSETSMYADAFLPGTHAPHTFAYVGSLSAWQCFEQAAAFYAAYEKASGGLSHFYVFTGEQQKARHILEKAGAVHYQVEYKEGEALLRALSKVRYGFVLRKECEVNRVATPVKLSTYAASGVIPLYSSVLADFDRQARRLSFGIQIPAREATAHIAPLLLCHGDPIQTQEACRRLMEEYYSVETYEKQISAGLLARFGKKACEAKRKKLLFVVGNLRMGGITNALRGLLSALDVEYEIALLAMDGEHIELPTSITTIESPALFRATETPLSHRRQLPFFARVFRVFGAAFAKLFGKALPFRLACACHRLTEPFDVAISFCQPSSSRSFCNMSNEFVLYGCRADRKLTFLHSDFLEYGGNDAASRRLYRGFDHICAVSNGVAERFLRAVPACADRISVVRNQIDVPRILKLAEAAPSVILEGEPVIISVCRLSEEKGLLRCIPIFASLRMLGYSFAWHLFGDGDCRAALEKAIREADLSQCVFLHGAVKNPYPYMARADLLLLPSYHEAAPLVLEEATVLGLPILATDTCSVRELIGQSDTICGVDDESLFRALLHTLSEKSYLRKRSMLREQTISQFQKRNAEAMLSFRHAMFGDASCEEKKDPGSEGEHHGKVS